MANVLSFYSEDNKTYGAVCKLQSEQRLLCSSTRKASVLALLYVARIFLLFVNLKCWRR